MLGIDIDWVLPINIHLQHLTCLPFQEYPNSQGAGNRHSPSDSANFLKLLETLRSALGNYKLMTAAVPQTTWLGENGQPLTNVSSYATHLSYVNIMSVGIQSHDVLSPLIIVTRFK